jgi:hypothetical protein
MSEYDEAVVELKRRARIQVDTAKELSGIDLDYSEDSITKLDNIISNAWNGQVPQQLDAMIEMFGAYLGEVLSRNIDGRWTLKEGTWMIDFPLPDGSVGSANVFGKVRKRFMNGMEDSLGYYMQMLRKAHQEGFPSAS